MDQVGVASVPEKWKQPVKQAESKKNRREINKEKGSVQNNFRGKTMEPRKCT